MRTLLCLLLVACHDPDLAKVVLIESDASSNTEAPPSDDVAPEEDASPDGDGPPPVVADPLASGEEALSLLVVVDRMIFPRIGDDGRTIFGLDLDGKVSDESDETTCGKLDQISPEGVEGIDNQLSTVIPLFEFVGLGAFETLVQRAIDEGGLLILFQLDGIDDLVNDPEVTMTLRLGSGVPLLGTDGRLLAGQTYSLHPESPEQAFDVRIEDGVMVASGVDTRIPIVVFGVLYELTFEKAEFRVPITPDGVISGGMMAGQVPLSDLIGIAAKANNNDDSILESVQAVLAGVTDLGYEDGQCTRLSAAIQFGAVSAFLFEDHFTPAPPP